MAINLVFADDANRVDLFPLALTRPIADLRVGILTLRRKWEMRLGTGSSSLVPEYLSLRYPTLQGESNLLINGAFCPDETLAIACAELLPGEALVWDDRVIARQYGPDLPQEPELSAKDARQITYPGTPVLIRYPWDLFRLNGSELMRDFELLTRERNGMKLPDHCLHLGPYPVFIEEGARVSASTFNTHDGPVYIGPEAEVMEGCMIRGPFALGEGSTLKMGAKIYGPTTIGPHSKVGGELNNVLILGYSNKAHDGFLGNAVIGEWCNIGADSNNSNLKNTYDTVKMWSYRKEAFISSGLQFCGLIMGDHSKCGINTMFNTGTVVGVSCNLFGSGFHRNFIPCFSWGGPQGFQPYDLNKSMQVASAVMERRGMMFDEGDRRIFAFLHEQGMRMFRK